MTPPATLPQIRRLQLTRRALELWLDDPEVEEVVKGCYVRVLVDKRPKDKVYKLSEVVGITADEKYSLGEYGKTDKHLVVQYGDQICTCKIDHISNTPFTEVEYANLRSVNEHSGVPTPQVQDVLYKLRKVKTYIRLCTEDDGTGAN
eukprot:EG_transcript_37989